MNNIPSITQCLDLHDRFGMYDNIRDHSHVVARVAECLVDGLERAGRCQGPLPDRAEAVAGALLHDIAKTLCIETGCRHAEVGEQICLDLGYPEMGDIVAEHVVLKDFAADRYARGIFMAKEIVYYADKRVCHDQCVSLDGRLEYILGRYGNNDPVREHLIHQNFKQTLDLEKYLFIYLDFHPTEINRLISRTQFARS